VAKGQKGFAHLPVVGFLVAGACLAFATLSAVPDAWTPKASGRKPAATRAVSGKVVETGDYCGGAAPTEQMLEWLRKEKLVPRKELFVRAGTANRSSPIVLKFATDAEGNFRISLPPGDYCIIEESKKEPPKAPKASKGAWNGADSQPTCLQKWYGTCDKTLTVGQQDLKDVLIKFHRACHPPCTTGGPPPV
jgi:hypothetical protein